MGRGIGSDQRDVVRMAPELAGKVPRPELDREPVIGRDLGPELDTELETGMDLGIEVKLGTELQGEIDIGVELEVELGIEVQVLDTEAVLGIEVVELGIGAQELDTEAEELDMQRELVDKGNCKFDLELLKQQHCRLLDSTLAELQLVHSLGAVEVARTLKENIVEIHYNIHLRNLGIFAIRIEYLLIFLLLLAE